MFRNSLLRCVFRQSLKLCTAVHFLHVKAEAPEVSASATFQPHVASNFQLFPKATGANPRLCNRCSQRHYSPEIFLCAAKFLLLQNDLGKETGVGAQQCSFTPRICTVAFLLLKGKELPVLWKYFTVSYRHSASHPHTTSGLLTLF